MTDKKAKIAEMIAMQKEFIAYEQKNGIDMKDYFAPESGHMLDGYKEAYVEKAMELVDIAHAEKGSRR